jgi:predicted transcriptional regulator
MAKLERLTVQVAPEVRAEIESAASKNEVSCAAVMRQALRDRAIRREIERRQEERR